MTNIIEQEVVNAYKIIKDKGVILYPTDTIWGLGCSAFHEKPIDKIFEIKQRPENKSIILLVSDIEMLSQYVETIPDAAIEILKNTNTPTTIIYEKAINLPGNIIHSDGSIAIRIVKEAFCNKLIKKINRPLTSTSANISGSNTSGLFHDIPNEIKQKVDYVVNYNQNSNTIKSSSIIKINNDNSFSIIRK